ncbi:MAG: hypothetical protein JF627_02580 [Alphaproteobacteria bacterium]|nr:hypothetical protein [Alphaproteobacteria bacterium]
MTKVNYFFFLAAFFLVAFFLVAFLAFFFAAMFNSSIVCSGLNDSRRPPKRHQYELLAF